MQVDLEGRSEARYVAWKPPWTRAGQPRDPLTAVWAPILADVLQGGEPDPIFSRCTDPRRAIHQLQPDSFSNARYLHRSLRPGVHLFGESSPQPGLCHLLRSHPGWQLLFVSPLGEQLRIPFPFSLEFEVVADHSLPFLRSSHPLCLPGRGLWFGHLPNSSLPIQTVWRPEGWLWLCVNQQCPLWPGFCHHDH